MISIECDFHSQVLRLGTSMRVLLPQPELAPSPPRRAYPTLYLLHGLSDDHTIWHRRTAIERHAEPYGLAVVMPAVHR
nr:esterase family protein [Pseudomonadota bacterium]